jgi:hypothetical protein
MSLAGAREHRRLLAHDALAHRHHGGVRALRVVGVQPHDVAPLPLSTGSCGAIFLAPSAHHNILPIRRHR